MPTFACPAASPLALAVAWPGRVRRCRRVSRPPVGDRQPGGDGGVGLAVGDVDADGRRHAHLAVATCSPTESLRRSRRIPDAGGLSPSLSAKLRCWRVLAVDVAADWSRLSPPLPARRRSVPPAALAVASASLAPAAVAWNASRRRWPSRLLSVVAVVWSVAILTATETPMAAELPAAVPPAVLVVDPVWVAVADERADGQRPAARRGVAAADLGGGRVVGDRDRRRPRRRPPAARGRRPVVAVVVIVSVDFGRERHRPGPGQRDVVGELRRWWCW